MTSFVRATLPVFILFLAAGAFIAPRPAAAVTVERVESPGGIVAWLVRDSLVPLVSFEFSFRGGAAQDPDGTTMKSKFSKAMMVFTAMAAASALSPEL